MKMNKPKQRKYYSNAAAKSSSYMRTSKKKSVMKKKAGMKRGVIGGKRSTLAYCVRCRRKTASSDQKKVTLRNNRCALKGNCGLCNSPKYMIISKAEMDSNRIWTNAERRQQRMVK